MRWIKQCYAAMVQLSILISPLSRLMIYQLSLTKTHSPFSQYTCLIIQTLVWSTPTCLELYNNWSHISQMCKKPEILSWSSVHFRNAWGWREWLWGGSRRLVSTISMLWQAITPILRITMISFHGHDLHWVFWPYVSWWTYFSKQQVNSKLEESEVLQLCVNISRDIWISPARS